MSGTGYSQAASRAIGILNIGLTEAKVAAKKIPLQATHIHQIVISVIDPTAFTIEDACEIP